MSLSTPTTARMYNAMRTVPARELLRMTNEQLCDLAGISDASRGRALRDLVAAGVLRIEYDRPGPWRKGVNNRRLVLTCSAYIAQ